LSASSLKDWSFALPADTEGVFLERPNRFLALVDVSGRVVEAHVHDPGRLPQILRPGTKVLLRKAARRDRRTAWDLLAGQAAGHWVLVHSGSHRPLTQRLLSEKGPEVFPGLVSFRPEPRVLDGRLDYLFEMEVGPPIYVETKGCTLAEGRKALFPDAPTSRGTRHLRSLVHLREEGFRTLLWVLVFRPETECFAPEENIDPLFGETFREALAKGLEIRIHQFAYDGERVRFLRELPLCLE